MTGLDAGEDGALDEVGCVRAADGWLVGEAVGAGDPGDDPHATTVAQTIDRPRCLLPRICGIPLWAGLERMRETQAESRCGGDVGCLTQ